MRLSNDDILTLLDIVDDETDAIIQNMRSLVDKTKIYEKLSTNQVSNLVNLARSTDSVEAIITWIQYQIGRSGDWKHNDFGGELVQAIEKLRENAIAKADGLVSAEKNPTLHDYTTRYLWISFVRHYVGHMQRYITYRTPKKDDKK